MVRACLLSINCPYRDSSQHKSIEPPDAIPMEHDADDDTARLTLDLLESRLRQAEYTIYGHLDGDTNSLKRKTVAERLHELEKGLDVITAKSKVAQDLLKLREFMPWGWRDSCGQEAHSLRFRWAASRPLLQPR